MNRKKVSLIFSIIIFLWIIPLIPWANGAKPIQDPLDQSIMFDENSGVALEQEKILFQFREDFRKADVKIEYKLRNTMDEVQSFKILFITPSLGEANFEVVVNGKKIENLQRGKATQLPKNWQIANQQQFIEPTSHRSLEGNPQIAKNNYMNIEQVEIPIAFEPQETVDLYITYESENGYFRGEEVINTVHTQLYYLTPAKFWEGEAKVTLQAEFPLSKKIAYHSNIPMEKVAHNRYEGVLDRIPEEEWFFSFVDESGLIFGTNQRIVHNGIVLVGTAVLVLSGLWFRKKKRHIMVSIVPWTLGAFLISFVRPSYGFMFMLFIFGPIICIGFLIFLLAMGIRKLMKSKKDI